MMKFFKSVWLRLRKSNLLPGNEVLIPMVEKSVPEVVEKVKKPRKPRKKKETKDVNDS